MDFGAFNAPEQVFANPAVQLAPFSPLSSLAAFNPSAALAAKSPVLNIFNPAVNPRAAFLAFNPAAAPTLALQGGYSKPYYGKPFGSGKPVGFGKGFGKPWGFGCSGCGY